MKFPKSVHAEGWADHIDTTAPEHLPDALKPGLKTTPKPGVKLGASTRPLLRESVLGDSTPPIAPTGFAAPTAKAARTSTTAAPVRSGVNPWLIGAGVGAALIGLAVTMSRTMSPSEPSLPPTVVGQANTAPASPEDAQLKSEPSAAGPVVAAPEPTPEPAPAVTAPPPSAEPRVAQAPKATPMAPAPDVVRAAPGALPAPKTLSPRPEVLAQASPPPVALREPALTPLAPVAPTVTPAPAVVPPPETATPVVPPLAQQTPPPVADPEDSGITVKVRMALSADATLAAVPIAVSTDHGVVKLEGQAPDAQARERATVVAAATNGVKAVDNRLTLPPVASLDKANSGG